MSLSLNDLKKKKAKTSPKPARPAKAKRETARAGADTAEPTSAKPRRPRQKPWTSTPPPPSPSGKAKFRRTDLKGATLTDEAGPDFSVADLGDNWLFRLIQEKGLRNLLTPVGLKTTGETLWYELSRRSYLLSRANRSLTWLKRARIPVPPFLTTKE